MGATRVHRLALSPPGSPPVEGRPAGEVGEPALYWIDVGPAADRRTVIEELLALDLSGLDGAVLDRLGDDRPEVGRPAQRIVQTADVRLARDADGGECLDVRTLALVADGTWVLTARDEGERVPEGSGSPDPLTNAELLERIKSSWQPWRTASGHDLAMIMLLDLVRGFPAVLDALAARQRRLEQQYLTSARRAVEEEAHESSAMNDEIAVMRLQLMAVDREVRRLTRPAENSISAWFAAHETESQAAKLEALLAASRAEIAALLEGQRATLQLEAGRSAVHQLRLADAASRRGQSLQRLVGYLTGILLVPTLVATVFGALPSFLDSSPTWRAIVVLGATVATAAIGAVVARRLTQS